MQWVRAHFIAIFTVRSTFAASVAALRALRIVSLLEVPVRPTTVDSGKIPADAIPNVRCQTFAHV